LADIYHGRTGETGKNRHFPAVFPVTEVIVATPRTA